MGTPHASPALTNSEHWVAPDVVLCSVQATFAVPLMNQAQSFAPYNYRDTRRFWWPAEAFNSRLELREESTHPFP